MRLGFLSFIGGLRPSSAGNDARTAGVHLMGSFSQDLLGKKIISLEMYVKN